MIQLTNLPEFSAALRHVVNVTKKAEAEIVTKAAKDVAFKSAGFTPKTTKAKIVSRLKSNGLLPALAAIRCNAKFGKGKWTREQQKVQMQLILTARSRGINAIRAGWIPAIQKLGGTYRGAKLRPGGTASEGTGKPATVSNLVAMIQNSVVTISHDGTKDGAGEIQVAIHALNQAIQAVTRDRLQYAEDKLKRANRAAQ